MSPIYWSCSIVRAGLPAGEPNPARPVRAALSCPKFRNPPDSEREREGASPVARREASSTRRLPARPFPVAKNRLNPPPEGMGAQQQQEPEEEDGGVVVKRRKVAAAAADVTMDLDVLDCPVCFHPLRPPIFQCTVGHTICSSCHDKLPDKCPFCTLPTVYSRCYMVEHVIESIKVPCSNGNHGCTAKITYYQKEDHEKCCQHAPCFCPKAGCGFSGPTTKLLDHFSSKHNWQSSKVTYKKMFGIRFQVGSIVLVGEDGHLFLVNMIQEPLGGVISVCCVHPHITGSKFKCRLTLSRAEPSYAQGTEFILRSSNLRDGFPNDCIPLIVPKLLLWDARASGTAKLGVVLGVVLTLQ